MMNMMINDQQLPIETLKKMLLSDIERAIYVVHRKLVKPGKQFLTDPLSLRSRIISIDRGFHNFSKGEEKAALKEKNMRTAG